MQVSILYEKNKATKNKNKKNLAFRITVERLKVAVKVNVLEQFIP